MKIDKISHAAQLSNAGDFAGAKKILAKILKTAPRNPQALYVLGATYLFENNYQEAIKYLKRAIQSDPRQIDAISSLGLAYYWIKEFDLAEQCFRQALQMDPNNVGALFKMGTFHKNLGRYEEAKLYFHQVLAQNPDEVNTLNNLGATHTHLRDLASSVECYQKAFALDPDNLIVFANLLSCLRLLRRGDEAYLIVLEKIDQTDLGVALFPIFVFIRYYGMWKYSERILWQMLDYLKITGLRELDPAIFFEISIVMLSVPEVDDDTLFWIHKMAGRVLEDRRCSVSYDTFPQALLPAKHWRVGYVSPDFRNHAVNTSLRALVNERNRDLFEVYCYSNVAEEDDLTEKYRRTADVFINITLMSDQQVAERIRQDGIHFLVDLAGYTFNGRLAVMAYRPAPVQIVYMGYPYTSGMSEVDYFLSDPFLDGAENAAYFTERQLRLPECFTSFDRLAEQEITPVVPCLRNGYITFGSLNNIYKLNLQVIDAWARILQQVSGSRLIINHPHCGQNIVRENLFKEFLEHGIAPDRVSIIWEPHPEKSFLRYYNDIDIVLDTFPLTGGTTTIDATWMGVPIVTLAGKIYPRRISYSILKNVGIPLDDLIAFSEEEYVQKAVALAQNPERISELRRAIPESLKTSVLTDSVRLTRHIETAYLQAWDQKFPARPVDKEIEEPTFEYVPVKNGAGIAAISSLNDMACYVLHEQGGWFETEYDFALGLAREGMNILDVGAGIGLYALPLAIKIGSGTLWAATKTPGEARLLQAGIDHNRLENVELLVKGDRKLLLDIEMDKGEIGCADIVRLNINASTDWLLEEGTRFFTDNSPLVMFGIKRDNQVVDTSVATTLKNLRYGIYRLIPSLNILAPFTSDGELDVFAMNLFACKEDRAELLAGEGRLAREVRTITELPGIHVKDWQTYLAGFPYTACLIQSWLNDKPARPDWEAYWVALNLYAQANDTGKTPGERVGCLQSACSILMMLVQASPNLSRLLTLGRVLTDSGRREDAVGILNRISATFDAGDQFDLDEPFLALTDEFAAVDPGEHLAGWLFASVLEQREKLRSFSSFFTGEESLPVLEAVCSTGFQSKETERRIDLIKRRAAEMGA